MKRLILTGESGVSLFRSDLADVVGMAPPRLAKDLGLIEFCRHCDTIELWFDPGPNDQLQLVWLLDYFRSHPEIVARLRLRLIDYALISATPEELRRWKMPAVDVTKDELETASVTWLAYRATTPEACLDLLSKDLSALPLLKPALLDLLEELSSGSTGLGATEMRLLELIARGYSQRMRSSISGGSAGGVCSAPWKSAPCSRGWRTVRPPPSLASMRNCAPLRRITTGAVTRHLGEAGCR